MDPGVTAPGRRGSGETSWSVARTNTVLAVVVKPLANHPTDCHRCCVASTSFGAE